MSKNETGSDVEFIAALADLLRTNDLTEIEVNREYGDDNSLNVRVVRELTAAPAAVQTVAVPAPMAQTSAPVDQAAPAANDPAQDPNAVTSPMVGTVYLQAEPGTPAFIKVGDSIAEGQTILIIEAMKTMNQIPAPKAGKVKRILVEDGSPVEFGAPLIILE